MVFPPVLVYCQDVHGCVVCGVGLSHPTVSEPDARSGTMGNHLHDRFKTSNLWIYGYRELLMELMGIPLVVTECSMYMQFPKHPAHTFTHSYRALYWSRHRLQRAHDVMALSPRYGCPLASELALVLMGDAGDEEVSGSGDDEAPK